MGNGEAGAVTQKIIPALTAGWSSVLLRIAFAGAVIYAGWCVLSYRVDRLERDLEGIQRVAREDLPRIRTELAEIKAELRWMSRSLGVPAKE